MALSSIKDFWIHPNALTITLNYFGNQQLIQTSMLAGAVIMAYKKDYIGYNAAHDFREWKLQAYPTQLSDTCAYYVHAELSRSGDTAMIIYSPVKRDIQGRTLLRVEKDENGRDVEVWDETTSTESFFIYLGTISASVDNDGATVERAWTDGLHTGTLATDQYRMEEAQGDWALMFELVNDSIKVLKTITSATINALTVATNFIFGGKTFTGTAGTEDAGKKNKRNDATLPTTGYVSKEIESLDDHFLIKDGTEAQSVGGDVVFNDDVTILGEQSIGGSQSVGSDQTIRGNQTVAGNQTIGGEQYVKGLQILHQGFKTTDHFEQGDIIQGAQVTKDGIASFAKVKTPSMQVYELTLNRKTAVQGEFVFSDGETIEEVTQRDDGTYQLRVREPYEGYITTFKVDDVLYSNINIIGDTGHATTGKCWMFVTKVDGATIIAKPYPSDLCPSGENIAPMPHMTITRHGNRTDKTRQDLFIISSETSSLTMLRGVDAPIVSSEGLYGVVLGKLPSTLLNYIKGGGYEYVNGEDPYVYARGVIVQDLIMLDYQGKPIRQEVYRGHWNPEIAETNPYQSSPTAYDTATHNGSLWQCMVSETKEEPREGIAEWLLKVSKGDDSTATMYELKPSANIIYYRTADKTLSINTLDVKVGQTTSHGYSVIDEQYVLEELGLKVSYAIDGAGERHDINISPVAAFLLEDGTAVIATEDGYGLSLEGDDVDVESIKDNITLYLSDTTTEEDMTSYIIPVVKDGEEGKEGKRGRMLYPAGDYDANTRYKIENNAAPFVKKGDTFYVLKWEEGEVVGKDPDKHEEYWAPFTYMKYLFAEFLMAQWAQFGSDKGAVFYDRFLFSQYGFDKNGNFVHYSDHKGDMFKNGTLSGEFTPSLAVDLYGGYIKANKLAETFAEYQYSYMDSSNSSVALYANEIDFNKTYNVKYSPHYSDVCLLTMPLADDIYTNPPFVAQADTAIDGLKSIVINRANMNWERSYRATIHDEGGASGFTAFENIIDASKGSLLLCATPKLFHPYTWYVDGGVIYNDELTSPTGDIAVGYFVVDGLVSNFLLLEQGMRAILRSCRDTDGKLYWYVENGSDFASMPYTVYVKMPKVYDAASASLIDVPSNISMWSNVGYETSGYGAIQRRCFVSKSLYEIYEKLGGSLNIDIKMTDMDKFYDMDLVENWSWEKCVDGISINNEHIV